MYRAFLSMALLAAVHFNPANAQTAASYSFSDSAGIYSSISGIGVNVPGLICDDCAAMHIPIGFTFRFGDVFYDTLSATSNGYISLTDTSLTHYNNTVTNITHKGFIMPFWDDLTGVPQVGTVTPAKAYYLTSGTAPNRVFTFEWQNFNKNASSCVTCGANFQVRLYETSNTIEFGYGPSNLSNMSGTTGIGNSYIDWQTVDSITSTLAASSSVYTGTLRALPASGKILKWKTITASVKEMHGEDEMIMAVFPNPANDRINIIVTGAKNELVTVNITDLFGKVLSCATGDVNRQLSMECSLPSGIYIVNAFAGNGVMKRLVSVVH